MSHQVHLKPGDEVFTVADDETVLAAALRAGIALPYGCQSGSCGSCMAKLQQGQVDYGEEFDQGVPPALNAWEQEHHKVLLCQARPRTDLVVEARAIDALQDVAVRILPARVIRMDRLADDVMRLLLKTPTTERLQFSAGQYVSLLLKGGRRRDFSLANAPHNDEYLELHIRRVSGGEFTQFVFESLKERAILRLQGPLGTFFLREDSNRPIILVGGGTGFAPLKGILEHAFYQGIDRPIHLYWGVRGRKDLYLNELVEEWCEKHEGFRYTPVLSEPAPEDQWSGRTGWVHQAVADDYPDLSMHDVYMSGPPPMIHAALPVFVQQGLNEDRLFYDSFEFSVN